MISPGHIMRVQQAVQMQSMEMKKHMDAKISQKTVKRQTGKRKQR